jgi:hypothetical protein
VKTLVFRPPECAFTDELRAMPAKERRRVLEAALEFGLPLLAAQGLPPGGDSGGGRPMRATMKETLFLGIVDTAEALRVPEAAVLREVILSYRAALDRPAMEAEYERRGYPGDPRRLSNSILRLWLESQPAQSRESRAMLDLALMVQKLHDRLDRVEKSINSYVTRPSAMDLYAMGRSQLADYLRRLGGKVPRKANREVLLGLIHEKEASR